MDRSHLLTTLCVALLAGIGLASWVDLPSTTIFLAFLASTVLVFWWWPALSLRAPGEVPPRGTTSPRGKAPRNDTVRWAFGFRCIAALAFAVACLGALRYQQVQPAHDERWVGAYAGRTVTLVGTVVDEPDLRIANVRYTVGNVALYSSLTRSEADHPLPRGRGVGGEGEPSAYQLRGKVLVTARLYPRYAYGDGLRLTCRLRAPEPFNGFDYDRYLARSDIYALCANPEVTGLGNGGHPVRRALLEVKARLQRTIDRSLPEPQSSLFSALLLGTRGGLPRPLLDAFAVAGLTHLIAISGSQITLVVSLLRGVAPYLGVSRPRAFWGISVLLVGYLVLIGAPASAVRAGIMGWLLLLAYHLGRQSHPWPMFALAAAAMAWQEPRILRDDVGFELSFAAVAGLILWQPMFERWLRRVPQRGGLRTALAMTLAAQLMTLPLVLVRFGRLSLVAPLANVLVVPLIAAVTVVGIGLLAAALLLPALGWALLLPAWGALSYLVAVAGFTSRLPYAAVAWVLPAWTLVPMYAALVGWGRRLADARK